MIVFKITARCDESHDDMLPQEFEYPYSSTLIPFSQSTSDIRAIEGQVLDVGVPPLIDRAAVSSGRACLIAIRLEP